MNFIALTIFPEMFSVFSGYGIIRKAIEEKKIFVSAINIRDFARGKHRVTDDRPYGGGCGMVMKPEPLAGAIRAAKDKLPSAKTILLTPAGRVFNHNLAGELGCCDGLILVCGRYEGVDERICHNLIDFEVSLGDYVMTGGELAAMVIIDAVARLIPGILGSADSAQKDSFSGGLLEHAQYTRPQNFEGDEVPEVLLSGHHKEIEKFRLETSLIRTFLKRKDLLEKRPLNNQEREILEKWCRDIKKIINFNHEHRTQTS
ncbi:MAG: tRNA (guanosine(37)-N1)-methyltransferase TrmD [Deltaproteobacteria bacterium]|nr:tRNA (guanosine(37)-N1)-methyltransferase TrmD [Deltaproteobacteria bacterium]